jgi:hypothetical protein
MPARGARWRLVLLAVVGAGLALCYYLLFVILAVVLIALTLATRENRARTARRAGMVLLGVAALTAVFWIPLLKALIHGGASQGGFVRPDFFHVFVGIGRPVALTVLVLIVVGALGLTLSSPASQAVAGLLVGCVGYQLVSLATLVFADNQLQPHRAVTMMWATFGAALPVAIEQWRGSRAFVTVAAVVAVPAVFALGSTQASDLASGPFSREAHERPALAQTRQISTFITNETGKPPDKLTILSGDHALLVTEPYYGFLSLRARYAHPDAHLQQRIEVLRAAARCPDARCATATLEHSRFGRIDALVLARNFGLLRIQTEEDRFPEPVPIRIDFLPRLLPRSVWVRKKIGGYKVLVLRSISRHPQPPPIRRSRHAAARACAHSHLGSTSRSPGSARCRALRRHRAGSSQRKLAPLGQQSS